MQHQAEIAGLAKIAGRGLQPRPKHSLSLIGKHCGRGLQTPSGEVRRKNHRQTLRTRLQTPSGEVRRKKSSTNIADGVANPVRRKDKLKV